MTKNAIPYEPIVQETSIVSCPVCNVEDASLARSESLEYGCSRCNDSGLIDSNDADLPKSKLFPKLLPGHESRFYDIDVVIKWLAVENLSNPEAQTIIQLLYMMMSEEYRKHVKDDIAHIDFSGRP